MKNENGRQIVSNKERIKNIEGWVKSLDKRIEKVDDKLNDLNGKFTELSTEIKTERMEHEKVLSIRIWLIAMLVSAATSLLVFFTTH